VAGQRVGGRLRPSCCLKPGIGVLCGLSLCGGSLFPGCFEPVRCLDFLEFVLGGYNQLSLSPSDPPPEKKEQFVETRRFFAVFDWGHFFNGWLCELSAAPCPAFARRVQ